MPITTIVREGEVSLDWGKIEGVDKYNIYRNEKLIASVNDSEYKDSSFNPDENYIYTIKASREVSENEYNTSLEELKKYNLSPTEKELEQLKYQEIEISKEIGVVSDHLLSEEEREPLINTIASTKSYDVVYKTFLKDYWVKNPNPLSKYKWFRGDNRSYSATSNKYRTKVNVAVNFTSNSSTVSMQKYRGVTKAYNSNKEFMKQGYADISGIKLHVVSRTSNKASFYVNHAVKDPLPFIAADIDYRVEADIYKNGKYRFVGTHDQAPHHEVYLKGSSYTTIHRAPMINIYHLLPTHPNKVWSKSNL
ncbi:hypothetical protein [Virgibacillus sp. MG-45]|uniref:hypothetical protein n=1 Tax=Virgibacillus sp. MG-45 TaxID=3102791 RepID=UPI002ED9090A